MAKALFTPAGFPGANHFTAIAPLVDPDSDMVQTLVDMARDGWQPLASTAGNAQ